MYVCSIITNLQTMKTKQVQEFKPTDRFLSIYVYKFPLGNCGGITDTEKKIFIPCTQGPYTYEGIQKMNETHLIFTEEHHSGDYWALNPIMQPEKMVGPMDGGNLAHCSDSRCKRVYHIHDRFETQEGYDTLSR